MEFEEVKNQKMKSIKIEKYEQLEQITEQEAQANTTQTQQIKDFKAYFIKTKPYYGIVMLAYKNNHLVYIDEQIHYKSKNTTKKHITATKKIARKIKINF